MAEAQSLEPQTAAHMSTVTINHVHNEGQKQPQASPAELRMFGKVIASGRTIKSQQRGEAELTEPEMLTILSSLLHEKPGAFLMRFGPVLDETDLSYFDRVVEADYEVEFRIKELLGALNVSPEKKKKIVQNRRFKCLKELMENSTYFTEEEMRDRDPLLFEQYIGQYLTEDERDQLDSCKSDMTLSSMILRNMDIDKRFQLLQSQRRSESSASQEREKDSSSEEYDSDSDDDIDDSDKKPPQGRETELSSNPEEASKEKQLLRDEFLEVMQMCFLSGKDKDFDYSQVDSNERYDSLDMRQRDDEDSYFDSEEPSWCERSHSNDGDDEDDGMECDHESGGITDTSRPSNST